MVEQQEVDTFMGLIEKAGELILEQLSTSVAKTQSELIEVLKPDMHYALMLFALRALYDDGKIVEEQMADGNFKWRKKEMYEHQSDPVR